MFHFRAPCAAGPLFKVTTVLLVSLHLYHHLRHVPDATMKCARNHHTGITTLVSILTFFDLLFFLRLLAFCTIPAGVRGYVRGNGKRFSSVLFLFYFVRIYV